ncbi:MAG: hypothetical protein J6U08_05650 [Paludibacteraceae bacterium]|nr:hypothetical protein [Paludibacteraceae bacterium]
MRNLAKVICILAVFFSMSWDVYSQAINYQKIKTTFTLKKRSGLTMDDGAGGDGVSQSFCADAASLFEEKLITLRQQHLSYFVRYKRISDDTIQVILLRDSPSTKRYLIVKGGIITFGPENLEDGICAPTLRGCRIKPTQFSQYSFKYVYNDTVRFSKKGIFPLKRKIMLVYTGTDGQRHSHQLSSPAELDTVPMDLSQPIYFDVGVPRKSWEKIRAINAEPYKGSFKVRSHTISYYGVDSFKTSLEKRIEGAVLQQTTDIPKLRFLNKSKVVKGLGIELFIEDDSAYVDSIGYSISRLVCVLPKVNMYDPLREKKDKNANSKK